MQKASDMTPPRKPPQNRSMACLNQLDPDCCTLELASPTLHVKIKGVSIDQGFQTNHQNGTGNH